MTRRDVPLDAAEIFAALARHSVEYVLIGGLAVQAHGHVRTTQDADLVPAPGPAARASLAAALEELGARPSGAAEPPRGWSLAKALDGHGTLILDTDAGGVDIHRDPPGAAPFPKLRERAMVLEVGGVAVVVAGRDDLIAMKRASGRPVDRGDVIALTRAEIE
ncbi:MAG TPA: hypothetical protein VFD31_04510 [Thermoleophilaceae bacterium]|nr:hypothetical protein [Thermoleophilaceae bacterium]